MNLRTYRAHSMADALAEVKRDLGRDAVILHTRTYRAGGLLGVGAKSIVEITASDSPQARAPRPAPSSRTRDAALRASALRDDPGADPAPAAASSRAALADPVPAALRAAQRAGVALAEGPATQPIAAPAVPVAVELLPRAAQGADALPRRAGLAGLATPVAPAPADASADAALRDELASIKRLVGQVLETTRRAAVAVPSRAGGANAGTAGVLALGGLPEPLMALYLRLLDARLPADMAEPLVGAVRDALSPAELADADVCRHALLKKLATLFPTAPCTPGKQPDGRPLVIALVGPTGVGKTTTIAKLAATFKLRMNKSVALVTCDTYRIAAADQLRTYATIIGLPMRVAATPPEMKAAVDGFASADAILLDTAGRAPRDAGRLEELRDLLAPARPHEVHLVLSAGADAGVIARAADRFGLLSPTRVVLTKLDEAATLGHIPAALRGIGTPPGLPTPLTYVTTGQEVPDQIEPADADRLARRLLDGDLEG
jgi:flagellar biosynthesis protein FlhF